PGSNGHAGTKRNGARPDPFARNNARQAEMPVVPATPEGAAADSWDPDEIGPDPRDAALPVIPPPLVDPSAEADEYYEEPIPYRPRAVGGVLMERDYGDREGGAATRMLGIIAGVAIAGIAILALAVFLTGRGGN